MFECLTCGNTFDYPETFIAEGYTWVGCPECASSDFEAVED